MIHFFTFHYALILFKLLIFQIYFLTRVQATAHYNIQLLLSTTVVKLMSEMYH